MATPASPRTDGCYACSGQLVLVRPERVGLHWHAVVHPVFGDEPDAAGWPVRRNNYQALARAAGVACGPDEPRAFFRFLEDFAAAHPSGLVLYEFDHGTAYDRAEDLRLKETPYDQARDQTGQGSPLPGRAARPRRD